MADITVSLVVEGDPEQSAQLSQEFSNDVAQLPSVVSREPPKHPADPTKRGVLETAAIVITAVTASPALAALVGTIGSYLARDRRTEIEIQTADGRKVRLSSSSFTRAETEDLLRQLLGMTGG